MKPGQTKVMIPQAHKIITEITIGYLTMPFPVIEMANPTHMDSRSSVKAPRVPSLC